MALAMARKCPFTGKSQVCCNPKFEHSGHLASTSLSSLSFGGGFAFL